LARARTRLDAFVDALDLLGVTEQLALHAGTLAEAYVLRAYDAVHLASAVAVADDEFVLVAADDDLLTAAREIGLVTAPVL
jgi:predicted nucleic acid-binding protein